MVLNKGTCLRYYKREDVQQAIIKHAQNKEIGTRYNDSFGKRPDVLMYPKEVVELALRGVTSFHASEEIWISPLQLNPNLNRKELDELRSGWDLVLDIDCPDWEISKITTHLFIKALEDYNVKNISCKFSGNKGFHIGVPFETFPKEFVDKKTKDMFPDYPKKLSLYLLNIISEVYTQVKENKIIFEGKYSFSLNEFKDKFGDKKFVINKCAKCKRELDLNKQDEELYEFICPKCEDRITSNKEYIKCEKCKTIMRKIEQQREFKNIITLCECGSNEYRSIFNPLSIIEVDTILLSSRHLYRMPYSLHEKSGLVSIPINPDKVMEFEREMAKPDTLVISPFVFLDRNVSGESARQLLLQAVDFEVKSGEERKYGEEVKKDYEEIVIESPIKEEFFPPCILKILTGIEDGKKRSVFILMNYLGKIGWNKKEIEAYLLKWNKEKNSGKNPNPLRDNYIKGQLHHFIPGDKLPPNCDNEGYYKGIGVCNPDNLCQKIKNPVNYTLLRWKRHLRDREEEEKQEQKKERRKERVVKKKEKDAKNTEKVEEDNMNEIINEEKSKNKDNNYINIFKELPSS